MWSGFCYCSYASVSLSLEQSGSHDLLKETTVRIAGAVLSFLFPSSNVGIDAAAFAILSAGGLPLVLTMILFLSMMYVPTLDQFMILTIQEQ